MLNIDKLSTGSVIWLVAAGLVIYVVYCMLHNLVWHPLASFPGPRVAAVTSLYRAYIELVAKSSFVYQLEKLHTQYGKQETRTASPSKWIVLPLTTNAT
jgi:hypothetical protein